jgi:hypothetical protein
MSELHGHAAAAISNRGYIIECHNIQGGVVWYYICLYD